MSHIQFTLKASLSNCPFFNFFRKKVEQITEMIPESVTITTMSSGIAGPIKSFSKLAKYATGNEVCDSPSIFTGIGIKNKIIPIKDIVINLKRPFRICLLL